VSRKKQRRATAAASKTTFSNDPFASLQLDGLPAGPEDAPPEEEAPSGWSTRKVNLQMQRKGRGGKTVTILTGWEAADHEALPTICKDVRKQLGCGGTVRDDEIELQGDLRRRVAPVLEGMGFKVGGSLG
jgi:translation initiation factor 1